MSEWTVAYRRARCTSSSTQGLPIHDEQLPLHPVVRIRALLPHGEHLLHVLVRGHGDEHAGGGQRVLEPGRARGAAVFQHCLVQLSEGAGGGGQGHHPMLASVHLYEWMRDVKERQRTSMILTSVEDRIYMNTPLL